MNTNEFCRKHGVRMSCKATNGNPHFAEDEWARTASHFKCVLHFEKRRMTVYFSQGPAIKGEPCAADILDCCASDAAGFENARSFEEWTRDLGYDEDSRKAERIYKAVERQSRKLKALLGNDLYDDLLWKTERL